MVMHFRDEAHFAQALSPVIDGIVEAKKAATGAADAASAAQAAADAAQAAVTAQMSDIRKDLQHTTDTSGQALDHLRQRIDDLARQKQLPVDLVDQLKATIDDAARAKSEAATAAGRRLELAAVGLRVLRTQPIRPATKMTAITKALS